MADDVRPIMLCTTSYGMKNQDLKNKDTKELSQMLHDCKTQLSKLSFELEAHTLKDTSQIKKKKKEIARVLTVLKQSKL